MEVAANNGQRATEKRATAHLSLSNLFDASLVGRRDAVGVEWNGAELTFGDVDARAEQLAVELHARGLRRGDRLCVHLPNSIDMVALFLACVRSGVIFVPMNTLYREREVAHIVGDADPAAIITTAQSDVQYPAAVARWSLDELLGVVWRRSGTRGAVAWPAIDGSDPAMIIYTSGTTGAAKGAVLSHDALAANGTNVTTAWGISAADRYLAFLPLFHVHGLANGIHAWLISGCRMRLLERFDHREAAAQLTAFRPSLVFGVPTVYVRLLDAATIDDATARAVGAGARLFVCGSAPLPSHVLEQFRGRFGHTILERYGMSEGLMITTNPLDGERRPGSVGMPFPGVVVRVLNDAGAEVPDGEVGEVHIRSPHLFTEYWRRPDATTAAFRDGWFRTGDLGVRAGDGYLTLRGRSGDLIISGGFNIYPREIEEFLLEDARIREAAVIGVPDDLRGEVPIAYVVSDQSLDEADLIAHCRAHLASFKVPRAFVRVDALPRTALGKVQKHLLPPAPVPGR
jgi:malonyl-CoA/methylmalonyl-CoA synthetase